MDLEKQEMINRIKRMVRTQQRKDAIIIALFGTIGTTILFGLAFGINIGVLCGVITYWASLIHSELMLRNDDGYGC